MTVFVDHDSRPMFVLNNQHVIGEYWQRQRPMPLYYPDDIKPGDIVTIDIFKRVCDYANGDVLFVRLK